MRTDTGTMKVVTPRSELFVLPSAARLEGQRVSVRNGDTFSTVSVVSLDDLPLAQTRRLLVAHLTDALPSGMRFSDETRTLMEAWGKLPHLAHRGSALLDLTLPEGDWHAWTVDATGKQVREYPVARAPGGAWTLDVSTVSPEGARFLYELVR
jgi:hypothetical protein